MSDTVKHPDAPWSPSLVARVAETIRGEIAIFAGDGVALSERDVAESMLQELADGALDCFWPAPPGVAEVTYLDAIRYELRRYRG